MTEDDAEGVLDSRQITLVCTGTGAMRWRQGVPVARFNTFTPPYVRATR